MLWFVQVPKAMWEVDRWYELRKREESRSQWSLSPRIRCLCFVLMWNLWGLPQLFPCRSQDEAQAPWNAGQGLSQLGQLYPPASPPISISSQAPDTLGSSVLSEHAHSIQFPLPSAFSRWASIHPSKPGSNITSVKPFPSRLLGSLLLPSSSVVGPITLYSPLFSISLSKQRALRGHHHFWFCS